MKETPIFVEDNIFRIIIPMEGVAGLQVGPSETSARVSMELLDGEKQIVEVLKDNPSYTTTMLAEIIGVSRKTVSKRIQSLKQKGIVERVGSDKKGTWKILL